MGPPREVLGGEAAVWGRGMDTLGRGLVRESEMAPHRTTVSGRLVGSQGDLGPFRGRDFPRAGLGGTGEPGGAGPGGSAASFPRR